VIEALKIVMRILPFKLLGLDTDNGSEFINYGLLNFCEEMKLTFTRSRAYRKNDQAHVEEKNGSIVRKFIGYDRYEGGEAWRALAELYAVIRLYVNFFQPSMKLVSKERKGAKVHKLYDKAKTPHQRLITSPHVTQEAKDRLTNQYNSLDPVDLLKRLQKLQNEFWEHAWGDKVTECQKIQGEADRGELMELKGDSKNKREYRRTPKPRKPQSARTWRTRKDPFEESWNGIQVQLALDPCCTPTTLLKKLIEGNPDKYAVRHLRTLQRRVAKWKVERLKSQEPDCWALMTDYR